MSTGPSGFKKLVRLVARTLYAGPCPPEDDTGTKRRKWDKIDTSGLGIVVLDTLTRREWVKEDLLAEELKVAPKLLRKTLGYLKDEHVLRREHRREGKRAQNKDVVVLATKGSRAEDQPAKAQFHSYCAIDYPSFVDMLTLRVHLIKQKLKSELEEENPVMNYVCPTCQSTFSSLDFAILLDRDTGLMCCDHCGTEVLEQFGADGQTGNAEDRRKRREEMRVLLQAFEKDLRPIFDQLQNVKGIDAPDYGSLTDWAIAQRAAEAAKARDGNADGTGTNDSQWDQNIEIDFGGAFGDRGGSVPEKKSEDFKALPPWMLRPGAQSADNQGNGPPGTMGGNSGRDGAEPTEIDKSWTNGSASGTDVSFKQYLEDIKRKHAYAEAMRAAKKRPPDEGAQDLSISEAKQEKKPKLTPEATATKDAAVDKKPASDDGIEWEDNGDGIVWEDTTGFLEADDGEGDDQYDEEAIEAARIADMESDAIRAPHRM